MQVPLILSSILLFSISVNAEEECALLKEKVQSEQTLNGSEVADFNEVIDDFNQNTFVVENNYCHLNLVGKMMYKGFYFKQDKGTATRIFHHLSEKGYAESQFNFALALSKNNDSNVQEVLTFLLGIYANNLNNNNTSHLAKKARILFDDYLDKNADYELKQKMNAAMSKVNVDFFNEITTKGKAYKQKVDNIVAIFSIGLLIYGLTATPDISSLPNSPSTSLDPFVNWGQGFGNPLDLPQIPL